ncbi:unnamed protein product, partial [Choristocarpus tenellus]
MGTKGRSNPQQSDMRGVFELPEEGYVSSLSLTPDGCYVLVGFGDGTVRVYSLALNSVGAADMEGTAVAQIKAKGMYSNTRVECHIETSEDGRFAFAGLLRGSQEMKAIDLIDLPRWTTLPSRKEARSSSYTVDVESCVRTHRHVDPKLRGFGAVAVVRKPTVAEKGEYRLFCGRGIKNIHVWSFKPPHPRRNATQRSRSGSDASEEEEKEKEKEEEEDHGEWRCLYDTHTNGATVELVAFRNGGLEGISKSTDSNIRVWDLSDPESTVKPPFRDVSNSKDTRVVFGDYAYGGTTTLSLVKLDAPAVANRMEVGEN